jgi:hypothetical protein
LQQRQDVIKVQANHCPPSLSPTLRATIALEDDLARSRIVACEVYASAKAIKPGVPYPIVSPLVPAASLRIV